MQSQSISDLIYLGLHWRYLQDAQVDYLVHGESRVLFNIDYALHYLGLFKLHVTIRAARPLIAMRQELAALPQESKLSTEQATRLQDIMQTVQATLNAEATGIFAYLVTDKRLDVRKLLASVNSLFRPTAFERLPEVARYDFAEAGKCIAFERPTAAAFHILRGTEDVLRSFYCLHVKRNRVKPLLWGPMTAALRARRRPPATEMLQNLDNIRLSFRNPTQHPDKIYDIQEVQDLFSLCVDVVNRMAITFPAAAP